MPTAPRPQPRTLPVPLRVTLPAGWRRADAASTADAGAAFLALSSDRSDRFVPTLTATGELRHDDTPLTALGDEAVTQLRALDPDVHLLRSERDGTDEAATLTQWVRLRPTVASGPIDLTQFQVVMALRDEHGPDRAVLLFALTAPTEQSEQLLPQFQAFVASVELATPP